MTNCILKTLTAFICKRSRMLALTVTLALGLSGAVAQTVTVDDIIYTIHASPDLGINGKATVADNRSNPSLPDPLVIPETITVSGSVGNDGVYDVTDIAAFAFSGCAGFTSVTIPSSVKRINDFMFSGCTGLTSVTIPASVETIGRNVFQNCTGLTSITLEDGLKTIGVDMFYGCTKLASVTIPASVETIGAWAFYDCTGLTSITLEDGLKTIGEGMFYGCNNAGFTSVTIPASVETVGHYAFYECKNLTELFFLRSASTALTASVFGYVPNVPTSTLYYPAGAETNYDRATFADGALSYWNFSAIDLTAPALTAGTVNRMSNAAATVKFTSNEAGTYYYQLDGTAPTAASLTTAGTNATALTAAEQTITLSGLATGAHTIYIAAKDAADNVSNLLAINIPTYVAVIPNPDPDPTIYVTGVSLNLTSLTGKVGDNGVELVATVTPRNATNRNVRWSTSDPLVATVTHYGLVNFIGAGTAVITVTTLDGDYTAECVVTVSSTTGVEDVSPSATLYAVPVGDGLQVYGLVPNEVFSIYNMSGQLRFSGKATAAEQLVPLREHGIYIVVSGNRSVRAVY